MKSFVFTVLLFTTVRVFGQQEELMRELEKRDTIDYTKQSWKREKQRREEELKKNSDAFLKQIAKRKKFFDSLFSLSDYSGNSLTGQSGGKDIPFEVNESYVIKNGSIRGRASDKPEDFIGGNIFGTVDGANFVVVIQHLYCWGKSEHSCTNYSMLVEFPKERKGKEIALSNSNAYARLGYWHFGSLGGVIRSLTYSGKVSVEKITNTAIAGKLEILFSNSDNTDFKVSGNFNLPLVDKSDIDNMENRRKN